MSWSTEWGGRATDFEPSLLRTMGKAGATAQIAVDALYGAVQSIGERDPLAWVRVVARGHEEKDQPGLGTFSIEVTVVGDEDSPVRDQLEANRPVDLLSTSGAGAPFSQDPERSGSEPEGS